MPYLGLCAVEWNPIIFRTSYSVKKFGIKAFQAFARHSFVARIAIGEWPPVWKPTTGGGLVRGPVKTEHDMRDFIFMLLRTISFIGSSFYLPT